MLKSSLPALMRPTSEALVRRGAILRLLLGASFAIEHEPWRGIQALALPRVE
jgi:hypothetical protein